MTVSNDIAIYAALVGTASLIWQAFTWWRSGPRLVLRATANLKIIGSENDSDQAYIVVTVNNRGGRATTINQLGLQLFESYWARKFKKPSKQYVVLHPHLPGREPNLPKILAPGDQWQGVVHHREEYLGYLTEGGLNVYILASHSDKAITVHVPPSRRG